MRASPSSLVCSPSLPSLLIACRHGAHMIMNPNCRPPSPKRTWDNEYQLLPSPLPLPSLLAVGQFRNGGYIISEYGQHWIVAVATQKCKYA